MWLCFVFTRWFLPSISLSLSLPLFLSDGVELHSFYWKCLGWNSEARAAWKCVFTHSLFTIITPPHFLLPPHSYVMITDTDGQHYVPFFSIVLLLTTAFTLRFEESFWTGLAAPSPLQTHPHAHIHAHIYTINPSSSLNHTISISTTKVPKEGLWLEFGVYNGKVWYCEGHQVLCICPGCAVCFFISSLNFWNYCVEVDTRNF